MPRISYFYGITIKMFHNEAHHLGRPHFHAGHGDDEATVDIQNLAIIAGRLPATAQRLVTEWVREHQSELLENWTLARTHQPLVSIDPLP